MSLTAISALDQCQRREAELQKRNRWLLTGGIATIIAVLTFVPVIITWTASKMPEAHRWQWRNQPMSSWQVPLFFELGLLVFTFVIAMVTRKPSRADVANQFLDLGNRPVGIYDNPIIRWVLVLMMLGLLYGEFMLIDAMKSAWINHRLRNVDRYRAAVILARLLTEPVGIDPRFLLQHNEPPLHLRELLAYLIVNEWADISPHGDRLTLVSAGRRALR